MIARKLKEYLDQHQVKYSIIQHSPAYTAQETAASSHVLSRDFAKTVVVHMEGQLVMLVLPANRKILLSDLREMLENQRIHLASEEELKTLFPDCEIGAMPPFGNLYGMEVFVDESLSQDEEIAFNAGSHTELIKLAYKDFERLVTPKVAKFSPR